MEIVTGRVWDEISRHSKQSKNGFVAVAYLGTDASRLLKLNPGDTLVVDASERAVKSGSTNPTEILKYIKNRVNVYSCTNLHSKVFVFDNTVFIGSANVSNHSAKQLNECVVKTTNISAARTARGYVRSIAREPLTPKYVKHLQTIYRPPNGGRTNGSKHGQRSSEPYVWVHKTFDREYTEHEWNAHNTGEKVAAKKIANPKQFYVDSIRYKNTGAIVKNGRIGDFLVFVYGDDVYPPCRLLGFEKANDSTIVFFESPMDPATIKFKKFCELLKSNGLRAVMGPHKSPNRRQVILGLWPSIHNA